MNDAISKITLDLQQSSTPVTVSVKRRDTGRRIVILLSDGGFEYEIAPDCYAVLTATKPDGNILYNHCSIDNNEISYEITEQTTAVAGRMKAEIKLYGADDHLVTSATFRIIVDGTVYDDNRVQSEDEISALTHLVSEAAGVIYEGNQMIGEGQQAIQNATAAVEMANQILGRANIAVDAAVTATNAAYQAALTSNAASGRADTSAQNADNATNRANTATQNAESVITKATKAAESATGAAQNANQAAAAANTAAQNVTSAKDQAVTAAIAANSAASSAETAARNANLAINNASTATDRANTAASNAENATGSAIAAAKSAADASASAGAAATEAVSAAQMARTASAAANTSASNANTASDSATAAAQKANTAAVNAEMALEDIQKVTLDIAPIVSSATGEVVSLDDSYNRPIRGLKLYGKTTQNGTPSPDAPVPLVNAGDGGSIGVAVMGRNLFNWLPLADGALGTSNGTLVETGDHYVVLQGKDGNGSGDKSYSNGWYQPGYNTTGQTKRVFLNKGDIVTVSADYTMLEYGYGAAFNIGLHLYSDGKTMGNGFDNVPVGVKTNVCRTFTVSESNAYYPVFSLNSGKVRIENIQIEYGTAVTAYEPYKASQTLTVPTPNGLPGIPVTSGGNYTDSTGQQWVCDEIDFTEGVYVQRVRKYVCTGTEVLVTNNESNWTDKTVQFLLYFNNTTDISVKHEGTEMQFTHGFVGKPPLYHPDEDIVISGQQYNRIYFGGRPAILGETRESVRAYLKAQYDAGTPLEIMYPIITPIETPLSDIDLSAVHTHYPNTTVFNDAGAGMKVQYVADTKRYIDKKFDQLAAAIVSN